VRPVTAAKSALSGSSSLEVLPGRLRVRVACEVDDGVRAGDGVVQEPAIGQLAHQNARATVGIRDRDTVHQPQIEALPQPEKELLPHPARGAGDQHLAHDSQPACSIARHQVHRISWAPQALGSMTPQYHSRRSAARGSGCPGSPTAAPWPVKWACTSATTAPWAAATSVKAALSVPTSRGASGRARRRRGDHAVGIPETFELRTRLVRPGGHVANVGVHGKPATLHLEDLWIKNTTIRTGLVDTYSTPTLLRLVAPRQIQSAQFVTHRFGLDEFLDAYDVFSRAGETGALKVVLSRH
jgi:alcohol dehydrogenase